MQAISSVIKIHMKDKWTWFIVPWLFVLTSSFLINLLIGHLINEPEGFVTGGLLSIFIFILIVGSIIVVQTFPFAIGMCLRRTDYFLGTAITIGVFSAIAAFVLMIMGWIETSTDGWGASVSYFHLPIMHGMGRFQLLILFFILMLNMFFTGFTIASFHKRFGKKGLFTLTIVFLLIFSIISFLFMYYAWWEGVWNWLIDQDLNDLTLYLIPLTAVYMLLSYRFLVRSMD